MNSSLAADEWRTCRRFLLAAALMFSAFVVYGSLVPLDWHPLDSHSARQRFAEEVLELLGRPSAVDFGVNVLLFVPLAFLWCGAAGAGRRHAWVWVLLMLPAWPLASASIEFAQLWFPSRRSSGWDVLAESLGGMVGSLLWLTVGAASCRLAAAWATARHHAGRWPALFYAYVAALFLYALLPLDLTLSPADLYGKWKEGRIVLMPFGYRYASWQAALLDRASDVAMWIPVGLLGTLTQRGNARRLVLWIAGLALLLELAKLPVLSRFSDLTDVLMATLGAALGVAMGHAAGWMRAEGPRPEPKRGWDRHSTLLLVGAAVAAFLLPLAFWFPYDFNVEPAFVKQRLDAFWSMPMRSLLATEELHAAGAIARKLMIALPLGASLALLVHSLPRDWRSVARVAATLAALAVVSLTAFGQLLVPARTPDATGAALMLLGVLVGAIAVGGLPRAWRRTSAEPDAAWNLARSQGGGDVDALARVSALVAQTHAATPASDFADGGTRERIPPAPVREVTTQGRATSGEVVTVRMPDPRRTSAEPDHMAWWTWLLGFALLALPLYVVTHIPSAPYNVRELLRPGLGILSVGLMAAGFTLAAALPWFMRCAAAGRDPARLLVRWPVLLALSSLAVAAALMAAVPDEAIADVVGAPVWGWGRWPAYIESLLRMTVLVGTLLWLGFGGGLPWWRPLQPGPPRQSLNAAWFVASLVLLPFAYWAIVVQAATDNLVELLADDASPLAATWVAGYVWWLGFSGALVAILLSRRGMWIGLALLAAAASALPGYWLANSGTEPALYKYNAVFSALQFLLSTDRNHYLDSTGVLRRFALAHMVVVVAIACASLPVVIRRAAAEFSFDGDTREKAEARNGTPPAT